MVVNFNRDLYNAGLLLPTKQEKMMEGYQIGPLWLRPLLTAKFFATCEVHGDSNRNERNLYCLDCRGEALCSGCTAQHRDHHVVQIRRSSYHDVVRVSELQKVIDLGGVQTYIINSAKVVFLNARPQPRHAKGVTKTCEICDRSLLDTNRYCSLGCKLTGIRIHNDMTFHLQPKNEQQQQQQHQVQDTVMMTVNVDHAPPAVHDAMVEDQQLAPPVPARSSVTSEDLSASSAGFNKTNNKKRSSSSSTSSKRIRSSRKASSKKLEDEGDHDHIDIIMHGEDSVKQQHQQQQQQEKSSGQVLTSSPVKELEMKETTMALELSLDTSRLATLKLGRSSVAASETTMEESGGSPTAVSSCSLAAGVNTELSPPTPPPTRTSKRRKGTPHRAPFGM